MKLSFRYYTLECMLQHVQQINSWLSSLYKEVYTPINCGLYMYAKSMKQNCIVISSYFLTHLSYEILLQLDTITCLQTQTRTHTHICILYSIPIYENLLFQIHSSNTEQNVKLNVTFSPAWNNIIVCNMRGVGWGGLACVCLSTNNFKFKAVFHAHSVIIIII